MYLGNGNAGYVYKIKDPIYKYVAVKIFLTSAQSLEKAAEEINIMEAVTKLIELGICPGFVPLLKTNIFDEKNLLLTNIVNKKNRDLEYIRNVNGELIYAMMPYYDSTFHDFIVISYNRNYEIFKSIIFQIIISVLCFQKYLSGINKGMHNKNILIKYVDKNTRYNYCINGKYYSVNTFGHHVGIADFGKSAINVNDPYITGQLYKLSKFWHKIVYLYYSDNYNLKTNKIIKSALVILRQTNPGNLKKWYWYDKTSGKGMVDHGLFSHLISSGFDYEPMLDKKHKILIRSIINILKNAGINSETSDFAKINLDSFGYNNTYVKDAFNIQF